jgi:DNA-binding FadR family transcriptional regulator
MIDPIDQDEGEATGTRGLARQRAVEAYDRARGGVTDAGRRAGDAVESAPLIALAGGLAAGALIAALLPRTKAETEALRPAAKRVRESAKAAIDAARETGAERLNELGLTREKGEETIRSLFQGVADAAKASGQAAAEAVKNQR